MELQWAGKENIFIIYIYIFMIYIYITNNLLYIYIYDIYITHNLYYNNDAVPSELNLHF